MPSDAADSVGRDRIVERIPAELLAASIIVMAVAIVSAPNLHGFWGRDDFAQLALARMIGAPWHFFVTDHYFVAASVFRPLGFFSLWLCVKIFGTDYTPHAAFDIALHAAVALCLFRVLLRPAIPPLVAAMCALLFALHPVTIGPALWWSARFDLQSTLFILLSISAGFAYRERQTTLALACALLTALAAMSSKENGIVATAALTLLWGRWMFIASDQRKRAFAAIAAAWLVALAFVIWRGVVLGTFSSGVTGPVPMADAVQRGLLAWAQQAFGYLSFSPQLTQVELFLIAAGFGVASLVLVASAWSTRRRRATVDIDILLVGALLFVFPIVTQAPIAAFASPLSAGMSAIEAGMQSRLYYLQTAGVALMLAALIGPSYRATNRSLRIAMATSLIVAIATFAWASHDNAQAFAQRSFTIAAPARAAVAAVESMEFPPSHCHIAFAGYPSPPEWGEFVSMDSIVKGLSVGKSIRHCWIHADTPTYFHMQPKNADIADALPFHPQQKDGREIPWRRVGNVDFAYLAPPDEKIHTDPNLRFFIMKDDRFVDVSSDARTGLTPVRLK